MGLEAGGEVLGVSSEFEVPDADNFSDIILDIERAFPVADSPQVALEFLLFLAWDYIVGVSLPGYGVLGLQDRADGIVPPGIGALPVSVRDPLKGVWANGGYASRFIDPIEKGVGIGGPVLSAKPVGHDFGPIKELHLDPVPADLFITQLIAADFMVHPGLTGHGKGPAR